MLRIKPIFGGRIRLALWVGLGILTGTGVEGQPAQLSLSSQIQYSKVIQGGLDPINAFVFNNAPPGASAGPYSITAAYGNGYANGFPFRYTGTQPANGGTISSSAATFTVNTANIAPGTVPVAVTLSNAVPNGSTQTKAGQFTVLAHARPSLVFGSGPPVALTSANVVQFQTQVANIFGEAAPAGTEAAGGGYAPQMLGDPPGEPTANLDLDSFSSFGSPNITTTLTPEDNLPSTDTPGTGEYFNILVEQSPGESYDTDFDTTFVVHYSDEQDLPGADAPGSQEAGFNVNVDIDGGTAYWTITTDAAVPDGSSAALLTVMGWGACLAARRRWGV